MTTRFLRNALILGLLSAVGPFAIDMYLPALPSIERDLGADTAAVQMSLMAFFMAFGACQMIYGPLSDMFGRKKPLYVGLALFVVASVGCALAPDIGTLIAFRFLQGVGACAAMVIPRAVVRDLHTGPDAAQLMSLLMLVFSVSPILAPLSGSVAVELASWRAIFWAVTIIGLLGLVLVAAALQETRPAEDRLESSVRSALAGYRLLLTDRHFLGLTFIGGFGISGFFSYLATSSFVLIGHFGLTPTLYSLFFSVNAVAFIGAAQVNGWLTRRYGVARVVRHAVTGFVVVIGLLFALTLAGVDSLGVLAVLLFIGFGFMGLVVPTTAVLAMEEHGSIAGTASALMGTLHLVCGALVIAAVSAVFDGTPLPMVGGIFACALVTWVLTQATLAKRPLVAAAE
jgi:DHA1 family bicyclomycin/chloramphenicol resistance-like MFS transporter